LLWLLIFLIGCGGSGQPGNGPGSAFRQTKAIGSSGDTISSAQFRTHLVIPANAVQQTTSATLEIFDQQLPGTMRQGFLVSEHRTKVTLIPADLVASASVNVIFPFEEEFDDLRTMMFVYGPTGLSVPLRVTSSSNSLTGTLQRGHLEAVGADPSSQEPFEVDVFTAHLIEDGGNLPPPLLTSVMKYSPATNTFVGLQSGDTMQGKRVAFLVHGVASELNDLVNLASYLSAVTYLQNGQSAPYYDEVWGFQYTSNAPIATIGQTFAESVIDDFKEAVGVDLFAHSMGNLVSRYAMETPSLGPQRLSSQLVDHFVGLGGPHEGVPFEVAQSILFYLDPTIKPCIIDLTSRGIDSGMPTFLVNLNTPISPDRDTAKYYTDAGSDYAAEDPPLGTLFNAAYFVANGFQSLVNDGLVAQYSALSLLNSVLATKSASWQAVASGGGWPTLPVSHAELKGTPGGCTTQNPGSGQCEMIATLGPWIASWIAANGLTPN